MLIEEPSQTAADIAADQRATPTAADGRAESNCSQLKSQTESPPIEKPIQIAADIAADQSVIATVADRIAESNPRRSKSDSNLTEKFSHRSRARSDISDGKVEPPLTCEITFPTKKFTVTALAQRVTFLMNKFSHRWHAWSEFFVRRRAQGQVKALSPHVRVGGTTFPSQSVECNNSAIRAHAE